MVWKKMSKPKGILNIRDEEYAVVLNRIIRTDFSEKVTSVQRFKGEEGVS